jgi:hypothetical protein
MTLSSNFTTPPGARALIGRLHRLQLQRVELQRLNERIVGQARAAALTYGCTWEWLYIATAEIC